MDALKKLVVITGNNFFFLRKCLSIIFIYSYLFLICLIGASSGIGAATASIFSKNGYPLLLLARRVD